MMIDTSKQSMWRNICGSTMCVLNPHGAIMVYHNLVVILLYNTFFKTVFSRSLFPNLFPWRNQYNNLSQS